MGGFLLRVENRHGVRVLHAHMCSLCTLPVSVRAHFLGGHLETREVHIVPTM
jgi:hypothetical protein